jgi:hypothetical protein
MLSIEFLIKTVFVMSLVFFVWLVGVLIVDYLEVENDT